MQSHRHVQQFIEAPNLPLTMQAFTQACTTLKPGNALGFGVALTKPPTRQALGKSINSVKV
jgi:hypothetical protein